MLSPQEKSAIRSLLQTSTWQIIQKIVDEYCQKVKSNSPIRESEWETLKELMRQEGKVEGVRNLIQEIFSSIE